MFLLPATDDAVTSVTAPLSGVLNEFEIPRIQFYFNLFTLMICFDTVLIKLLIYDERKHVVISFKDKRYQI